MRSAVLALALTLAVAAAVAVAYLDAAFVRARALIALGVRTVHT
jgi:hypothetical protein